MKDLQLTPMGKNAQGVTMVIIITAVSADNRLIFKENEKRDKYLDLARGLKKTKRSRK